MKRILFVCCALMSLFLSVITVASASSVMPSTPASSPSAIVAPIEYQLPYPGLLPDHPLYPIKRLRDRILLFFTRNKERKSELYQLLADKKLAMAQLMWDKNKRDLAVSMTSEAEMDLLSAAALLQSMKRENILSVGKAEKMEIAAKKHEELILTLLEGAAGTQQSLLQQAVSVTHQAMQLITTAKT